MKKDTAHNESWKQFAKANAHNGNSHSVTVCLCVLVCNVHRQNERKLLTSSSDKEHILYNLRMDSILEIGMRRVMYRENYTIT